MTPREWPMIALAVVAALIALALLASTAEAQQICGDRAKITSKLSHEFRELPQVIGQDKAGNVIEVWAGQEGTWTIVRYFPSGRCCILTSGTAFSRLKAAFGEPL